MWHWFIYLLFIILLKGLRGPSTCFLPNLRTHDHILSTRGPLQQPATHCKHNITTSLKHGCMYCTTCNTCINMKYFSSATKLPVVLFFQHNFCLPSSHFGFIFHVKRQSWTGYPQSCQSWFGGIYICSAARWTGEQSSILRFVEKQTGKKNDKQKKRLL